jgi:hypothetical protein
MKLKLPGWLWMLLGASTASAQQHQYDNSTMTEPFRQFIYGNQVPAIIMTYTAILGEWFYVIIFLTPYAAMTMSQRTSSLATIWLMCCFIAYGELITGWAFTGFVAYLLIVVWVWDIIRKFGSPFLSN